MGGELSLFVEPKNKKIKSQTAHSCKAEGFNFIKNIKSLACFIRTSSTTTLNYKEFISCDLLDFEDFWRRS